MKSVGYIEEIFCSIQGEGMECGLPYVFIRFCECNIRCRYCDTPHSLTKTQNIHIFTSPANTNSRLQEVNPIDITMLLDILEKFPYRNLTFTGGEPLLQSEFIDKLLPKLFSWKKLMETNGTLYDNITPKMIEYIERWAVDIKLPSLAGFDILEKHSRFLQKLKNARSTTIKVIFSIETSGDELKRAADIAYLHYNRNPNTSLVFQPLTENDRIVTGENLNIIYDIMSQLDMEVRLIPQIHRILNIP